jgi:subtilisin family serine protease
LQVTHPDLAANIWSNLGEAAGDRRDNDNNGFVDDVNGWDFVRNDGSVYDSSKDNHGTHVAGTIGEKAAWAFCS